MLRIIGELLHPIAQLRGMHTKVLRCLRIRHAALLDQAHSLKLELACELPPLHDPPPVLLKHLTRCLRNRVQACKGGCEPTEASLRLKSGRIEEQVKVVASPRNQTK